MDTFRDITRTCSNCVLMEFVDMNNWVTPFGMQQLVPYPEKCTERDFSHLLRWEYFKQHVCDEHKYKHELKGQDE